MSKEKNPREIHHDLYIANMYLLTQLLQHGQDVTQGQFLSKVMLE